MPDEHKEYEIACRRIRAANEILLADFEDWLTEKGLSPKTIENHVSSARFYINEFLLYSDAIAARDGAGEIGMFLGYWFIRKALWASKRAVKGYAASLKKFYAFMHEKGLLENDRLDSMKDEIKECIGDWLAAMERYDDPENNDPFNVRFL